MATLSSPGLGSGLDVNSIVTKLVAIERQPIEKLQQQSTAIQAKLSSFGLLQSYMSNVRDIADRLSTPSFWTSNTATTSDAAVGVSATATATNGSYSVAVSQLAGAQSLASKAFPSTTTTVGNGTLRIEIGGWNADQTAFTPNAAKTPIDIVIAPGQDSLDAIKTQINAANAGVSASIVNDASGARLVMRSTATGATNAVRVTATDSDGSNNDTTGLSALAFDPPNAAPVVPPATGQMAQTLAGKDTLASINGLAVTSSSATLANVIDGVTLTVNSVTTTAATVAVGLDTATQRKAIADFAKALSDVNSYISTQTKYDATTKKAATLQGDRATLTVQSTIRAMMVGSSGASGSFSRLNDIGVELQKDGTLKVNDTRLSAALANPTEVAKLFSNASPGAASAQGFGVRAKALAVSMLGVDGAITTHSKGLRASIQRNADEQQTLEDRVASIQTRLQKQYSALDTLMGQITNQNNSLTQSLTGLANLSATLYR